MYETDSDAEVQDVDGSYDEKVARWARELDEALENENYELRKELVMQQVARRRAEKDAAFLKE